MVEARKRPDVTLKVRQKLYGDRIAGLRHKIPLRHLQFIALQRPRSRQQAIARAGRQHQKIRRAPFAVNAIARLGRSGIHADHMRPLHFAAGIGRASEQHAIQYGARINHDGMAHIQHHALLVAADQLDRTHQLFGIGIIEEKREALDGFMGQPPAARLFPGQVLVKNVDAVSGARQLLATHRSGWPATDDCNLCHVLISGQGPHSLPAREFAGQRPFPSKEPLQVTGNITRQNPARSIAPKTAAAIADPVCRCTRSMPSRWKMKKSARYTARRITRMAPLCSTKIPKTSARKAIRRRAKASQMRAALLRTASGPSSNSSASRYASAATNNTGKRTQRAQVSQASVNVESNQPVTNKCSTNPASDARRRTLIFVGHSARTDL